MAAFTVTDVYGPHPRPRMVFRACIGRTTCWWAKFMPENVKTPSWRK